MMMLMMMMMMMMMTMMMMIVMRGRRIPMTTVNPVALVLQCCRY